MKFLGSTDPNVCALIKLCYIKSVVNKDVFMARYGVTYQAVAQAAHTLLEQGRQPTVDLVRSLLGTGSSTTIANHLRQWKTLQNFGSTLETHPQLPVELLTAVQHVWEKTLLNVQQTLQENVSHLELHDLQKQCEKYKNNNQRWQKLFEQWQVEKNRLDNELELLKQQNNFLAREVKALKEKMEKITE